MTKEIIYKDLGKIEYAEAWEYQRKYFNEALQQKIDKRKLSEHEKKRIKNHLFFCEHPHVYTLGKSGDVNNLLIKNEVLKTKGVTFFKTDRGGDITYHGPGQITGYPILDLEQFNLSIKSYVYQLEESVIEFLKQYNIKSERLQGATGVWLDTNNPLKARKICAIGIKSSRWITMHGFAFNINTDLEFYNYINPCGFTDKGVTSMEKELGYTLDMEKLKIELKDCFGKIFKAEIY